MGVNTARLHGAAASVLSRGEAELEPLERLIAVDTAHEEVVIELARDGAIELIANEDKGAVLFDEHFGDTSLFVGERTFDCGMRDKKNIVSEWVFVPVVVRWW